MTEEKPIKVLFVCLGNICRSPMAEGIFSSLLASSSSSTSSHPSASRIAQIDSAGTGAYHALSPPDSRTMAVLRKNGINDYDHAARKVALSDFVVFDYIFGMDSDNVDDLLDERGRALQVLKRVESSSIDTDGHNDSGKDGKQGSIGRGSRRSSKSEEEFIQALSDPETQNALKARGGDGLAQVQLYGTYGGKSKKEEVIDPYYGGKQGFEIAFEQLERFGNGFLRHLDSGS